MPAATVKAKLDLSALDSILSVMVDSAVSAESAYGKRNAVDGKPREFTDGQKSALVREGFPANVREQIIEACVSAVLKAV